MKGKEGHGRRSSISFTLWQSVHGIKMVERKSPYLREIRRKEEEKGERGWQT